MPRPAANLRPPAPSYTPAGQSPLAAPAAAPRPRNSMQNIHRP
jgi:hypothetical protein